METTLNSLNMEMASLSFDVKVELMQTLKEMRTTDYALQLCILLIKAQKIHEDENTCKGMNEHIFTEVETLLNHVHAEELVKKIFKVLRVTNEKFQKEEYQLLNYLKSENKGEPSEYLNQLIGIVECLVKSLSTTDLNDYYFGWGRTRQEPILVTLKCFVVRYGSSEAEDLFFIAFRFGLDETSFSCEEIKEIGDLMIHAIPLIEICIRFFSNLLSLGLRDFQKRSALQFIKDLLADYYAENESLKVHIEKLNRVMQTLDNIIFKWCDSMKKCYFDKNKESVAYFDDFYGHQFSTIERIDSAGGSSVPKEHFWWRRYKEVHFYRLSDF